MQLVGKEICIQPLIYFMNIYEVYTVWQALGGKSNRKRRHSPSSQYTHNKSGRKYKQFLKTWQMYTRYCEYIDEKGTYLKKIDLHRPLMDTGSPGKEVEWRLGKRGNIL